MGKYVFLYIGGGAPPEGEEARQRVMQAWMDWLGGLGDAVVDMGSPLGASVALSGGSPSGATGYSIVTAESLDDAVAKARGCPIFDDGGDVEVYEAMQM